MIRKRAPEALFFAAKVLRALSPAGSPSPYLLGLFFFFTVTVAPPPLYGASPYELNARAVTLLNEGKEPDVALRLLLDAHNALPYDSTIRKNLAEAYLQTGLAALQERRYDDAAESFHEGKSYADDDPRFWFYRGVAYLKKGEVSAAESEINVALGMSGDDPAVKSLLARVYYDSGRLYEALEILEEIVDRNPDADTTRNFLEKVRREFDIEAAMSTQLASNFTLSYDGERHPDLGSDVLAVLEEAYADLGADLNFYPDVQIPVILYTQRDFQTVTSSPNWAGGVYDGKIRIPVGGVSRMSDPLRAILYHEYSHVLLRYLAGTRVPAWLNEGIAEIAGRRHLSPPTQALQKAREDGTLLDFAEIEDSFSSLPRQKVLLAYEQSYSFAHFLVERYGWHKVLDWLLELGKGSPACESVKTAFEEFTTDCATLRREWFASLTEDR